MNGFPVYLWSDSGTELVWNQRKEEWRVFMKNKIEEMKELINTQVKGGVGGGACTGKFNSGGPYIQRMYC